MTTVLAEGGYFALDMVEKLAILDFLIRQCLQADKVIIKVEKNIKKAEVRDIISLIALF